jgi:hypothetical protein
MDISEPEEAVATELSLPNELLVACLSQLSLHSLPRVSRVNHRWKEAARVAFNTQLRWRGGDSRCIPLPLPVQAVPARASQGQIRNVGFSVAFLRSGELVVQIVDEDLLAIRTVSFAGGDSLPRQLATRSFDEHGPFNCGVGGVVGYRQATQGMTFFPLVSGDGTAASEAVCVADGSWQNVLQAGRIIFLLRAHVNWWEEERITADLIDSDSGGRAVVDVTPLRDALKAQLQEHRLRPASRHHPQLHDAPARSAVSAAAGHFIFHLSTQSGDKVAAALRLPSNIAPHGQSARGSSPAAVDCGVAFARRWPATHAIARLHDANE